MASELVDTNYNEVDSELRLKIVDSALRITAFAAPFISFLILVASYLNEELNLRTWLICAYPLVFPILVLLKNKLSLQIRGTVFLSLMMLMGFLVLFRGGISIAQAALQLWILLIAALLFGVRGVAVTLLINLTGFAVAGYLVINGLSPTFTDSMWNPEYPLVWVRGGIVLALFGGASAFAVAKIVNQLERDKNKLKQSLAREQQQRIALEEAKTENQQAQEALANAQRTEALGKMASGIAHDFNNALTIIMGSAEIAMLDTTNNKQVEKSLNSIVRASSSAAELTRSLLSFGRKDPTQETPVEVNSLIKALKKPLSRLLPDDINLTVSIAEPVTIVVDKAGLEKTLFNLIANSSESIKGSGEISLKCESITVANGTAGIPPGEYAKLSVLDNGEGIDAKLKDKIFEPYFTTKEASAGAGLGLALLQSLMNEAGGHITFTSELGEGTEFSLYFPIVADSEKHSAANGQLPAGGSPNSDAQILLVEDNAEVLSTMTDTLSNAGYKVTRANDGNEAIEKLEHNEFDLLCIDGVIPGISSANVIEEYRKRCPDCPIVVCSGYIEEELLIRGIKTGELGYLRKPYRSQQLLDTISKELASSKLSS